MSKPVIGAFKGQLVVSKGELPDGKNDKDTIAKIKKAQLKELDGHSRAKTSRTGLPLHGVPDEDRRDELKLEFYEGRQASRPTSSSMGVDPKSSSSPATSQINEDEGLAKGKTYTVKLVTRQRASVAKTTLTMK